MTKWAKRTEDSKTRWPQGDTFSEKMCKELNRRIENHKPKGLGPVRKKGTQN